MGRPKGSKNKPKPEKPRFTLSDEPVETPVEVKPKRHRRTKAEMAEYRASLEAQKKAEQEAKQEETEIDQETISDTPTEIEIDQAVVSNTPTDTEIKEEVTPTSKRITRQKKQTNYPLCDCCQEEIYSSPHRIDTNVITAQVADYHRESPRWVNLCSKCALGLSATVDNWLQEHGCITRMEQRWLKKENT